MAQEFTNPVQKGKGENIWGQQSKSTPYRKNMGEEIYGRGVQGQPTMKESPPPVDGGALLPLRMPQFKVKSNHLKKEGLGKDKATFLSVEGFLKPQVKK